MKKIQMTKAEKTAMLTLFSQRQQAEAGMKEISAEMLARMSLPASAKLHANIDAGMWEIEGNPEQGAPAKGKRK